MNWYAYIFLVIGLSAFASCTNETSSIETKVGPQELSKKLNYPFNTPKVQDEQAIVLLRSYVKELINAKQRNIKSDLFELTYYFMLPYGFANDNNISAVESNKRLWLKFADDFTYEYGSFNEVMGNGVYNFLETDSDLFMLDNDSQIEPKFWSVKSNSDHFSFIGKPIIVVKGEEGGGQVLLKNLANDDFLNAQNIMVSGPNGMQLLMNKSETIPMK